MKQVHSNVLISSAVACVVLAAQPVLAQTTQITEVKLNPVDGGISVILKTSSGNKPQIFTTKRDKALVGDIINTQLRLPQGKSFRQEKPAPGIASVEVNQLDANSVRVTVMGIDNAPAGKPVVRENNNLTLGFTTTGDATAAAPTPTTTPTTPNTNTTASAPPTPPGGAVEFGKQPDVLVPNPEITIDGKKAQPAGPNQPYNLAPPFLPRAVAPPVGDITVSNIDTSPTTIDLGTQERVPRLVLRDAPVREVLSLLARAAGLNLAYVGSEGTAPPAGQTISQTISLDIENEPVQDVFNYVLRLSGLEANRSGRTIFVGAKLPNSTRDTVMRSLRLNQVSADVAINFLVSLGAESSVSVERTITNVVSTKVGEETAKNNQEEVKIPEVKPLSLGDDDFKNITPLLRGLQAVGDLRTNSVTLIGSPKLVDMAISQLTQLDIRRRQVMVNVKIIDVNLSNFPQYNTSFSFGIGRKLRFNSSDGLASVVFDGDGRLTSNRSIVATLDATVESGNAKILTDPTLIVQEGQTASVNLTQEVVGNFKRDITDTVGGSREVITIEKTNVGLTLSVKIERIDDNGFVSLSVAPVVRAPADAEVVENAGRVVLISERSLQSGLIRLRDGQTLILSGIIQDQDRATVNKVPILGDIPLIGSLFRSTNRENVRREVIVLLTPQVMDDTERSSYGYNYNPSPQVR
ncbi:MULTISPECIES: AMIN domain-containing protein [unclassified Sphaerospermopsis]|uniref:AMIN domain-containing protein n=1 Tax=unclassified Sphaerospermopsis TaxID=2646443 RepID=UPI0016817359|nr:AMIN domain-containing protein [Sphaerospermopsis sp. FACHB-1094]MBD2146916.1 AMIN domain-containing protein [Sphaerospermopsis sp. FACHB-1194]